MIDGLYKVFKHSSGVCTDTRKIKENNIFFSLKGGDFNGNDFALEALSQGCSFAIVDESRPEFKGSEGIIEVKNALETLQQLAYQHRRRLKIPFIALTGSNGKTTTKELLKSALSEQYECYATQGNFNNHIGVPLSILEINPDHEIAIIEMGANHQGEIADLCRIAKPDYGLITNIGLAHLEGFGGEEGVFKGKKELFDFILENNGTLFINLDDEKIVRAATGNEGTTYGSNKNADYSGTYSANCGKLSLSWTRSDLSENHLIQTQLTGSYNFSNVMAAIAVSRYFGVSPPKIKAGITKYKPSNQRSQMEETTRGNSVIIDCYNANPSSMSVAINNLIEIGAKTKVVILGDMMELGNSSLNEHSKILVQLQDLGIEKQILIGSIFLSVKETSDTIHFSTTEEAADYLRTNPIQNSNVLLKGSRKMKLENLFELL